MDGWMDGWMVREFGGQLPGTRAKTSDLSQSLPCGSGTRVESQTCQQRSGGFIKDQL